MQDFEVVKGPVVENSSFDGGESVVQGSTSGFYGQSSTSVETGGNGRQFRYDSNIDVKTEFVGYVKDVGQSMIGIGEGVVDVGKGLYDTVRYPVQTGKAIGSAAAHPVRTARAAGSAIKGKALTLVGDDPRAAGCVMGQAAGDIQ